MKNEQHGCMCLHLSGERNGWSIRVTDGAWKANWGHENHTKGFSHHPDKYVFCLPRKQILSSANIPISTSEFSHPLHFLPKLDQLYSLHHAFTHLSNVLGVLQHTNAVSPRPAYLYLLLIDVQNSKDDKSFCPITIPVASGFWPRPLEPRPSQQHTVSIFWHICPDSHSYSLSHFSLFFVLENTIIFIKICYIH